jgi:hypothetical protein
MELQYKRFTRRGATIELLKEGGMPTTAANIRKYLVEWWYVIPSRNTHTFRLSTAGFLYLTQTLNKPPYTIPLHKEAQLTTELIVLLNKQLYTPFHIGKNNISVFSESYSVSMYLFADTLRFYGPAAAKKHIPKRYNGLDNSKWLS